MQKYIVLKELELENGVFDQKESYWFDSEAEANQKAADVYYGIPVVERDKYTVSTGIVDESDLEVPDNWDTYTQVDILYSFEEDEERDQ